MQTVGNWSDRIEVPLSAALNASVELLGLSGYKACEKAISYMAKSAGAMTPRSPKMRKVVRNPAKNSTAKYGFYSYDSHGNKVFNPIYDVQFQRWMIRFPSNTTGEMLIKNLKTGVVHRDRSQTVGGMETSKAAIKNDWRLIIGNSGLGARSWMWGLKGFSKKKIPGVTDIVPFTGPALCGILLTDRVKYLTKIIPSSLVEEVSRKATNSIMFQAASEVERRFMVEIPRLARGRKVKETIKRLETEFGKHAKGGVSA
jgi:hypothetical protein